MKKVDGVEVASPDASEVRTLLSHGVPPVIFTCHPTSSIAPGVAVQIPMFPQSLNIPVPTFHAPLRKKRVEPVTAPTRLRFVAVMTPVQVARPFASEISILQRAGEPHPIVI
jgi:hypothetical protein